ncbi:unnamed protein product [Leptidea sinapis]|uniref:KHDC4/BBP-like KH-domain type I domain-containing protein n=1 Tax=Leptidea sinapis TaxID=189913 RepID=A0A5E4QL90_9NEOP|nr:unnamed protein product [Leptidea sinapis]
MLDITRDKPVKVCVRVVVPVRDHPKFNFVGKLLGPKGNSLKRLQEDTMCKMAVLGRGSMKDRQKKSFGCRVIQSLLICLKSYTWRSEQMLEMQILSSQTDQRRLTPDSLNHSTPRDFSPPALTPAPEHLPHHQWASQPQRVGRRRRSTTTNTCGGDILGLSSPVLGGMLHAHPALRGVKPTALHALATQGVVSGGANTRKRPMLGGRNAMSPTKRAVMTLLARARAATHKNAAWPRTQQQSNLLPFIRDDLMASVGVNINLT